PAGLCAAPAARSSGRTRRATPPVATPLCCGCCAPRAAAGPSTSPATRARSGSIPSRSADLGPSTVALIALKIDVDTYRGTRESVPRLADLLGRLGVPATFLFSLGPDHTGRAIRRVF